MNDLIFVSMESWDEVWRRNQFICAELATRHPDRKILFVGLPVDVSNLLRRGRWMELLVCRTTTVDGLSNIVSTRPVKLFPNSLGLGRRINELMFRRHVRRLARKLHLCNPALWLNPHSAVHMAGAMKESCVIYDITDDWTTITQSPRQTKLVMSQDEALCRRADATIVCSDRLLEMKKPIARRLFLVPNGVDCRHYQDVSGGGDLLPDAASRWLRPVYGYTGTVHPDRVDVELVREFALRVDGTVVLVGPDMLPRAAKARLNLPNIVIHGPVPYQQLPRYMKAFDVSIVPHRMTVFTESLNPIKLWEYLAAGKPIVSTDVAGFRDYPRLVRLARSADEFVAAARAALDESSGNASKSPSSERRRIAAENSWSRRVDEIERIIDGIKLPSGLMSPARLNSLNHESFARSGNVM